MKRTLSGELPPSPTAPQHHNPDTAANAPAPAPADNGAPRMQAPALNADVPVLAAPNVFAEAERPDLKELSRTLPHTPPQMSPRHSEDETSASDVSGEETTTESSEEDSFDEDAYDSDYKKFLSELVEGLSRGQDTMHIPMIKVREVVRLLELCRQYPQIKRLTLESGTDDFSAPDLQQVLADFIEHHPLQELRIKFTWSSERRMLAPLLTAIFKNPGLKKLSFEFIKLEGLTAEQAQSVTEDIKNHRSLEALTLECCYGGSALLAILKGLENNTRVKELALTLVLPPNCSASLAAQIRNNPQLGSLRLNIPLSDRSRNLEEIARALADSRTLQVLDLIDTPDFSEASVISFFQLLRQNRSLRVLRLPRKDTVTLEKARVLPELIEHHPTLQSLTIFSLQPDTSIPIAEAIRKNPRLTTLELYVYHLKKIDQPVQQDAEILTTVLNTLGGCPGLTSISFFAIPSVDWLSAFIDSHPNVRSIGFLDGLPLLDETERPKLLNLLKRSNQILESPVNKKFVRRDDAAQLQFEKDVEKAVDLNRQNTQNIAAAGMGMSVMLGVQRDEVNALPELPLDVTNYLAESIAFHLPQEDTKRVFETMTPYAGL